MVILKWTKRFMMIAPQLPVNEKVLKDKIFISNAAVATTRGFHKDNTFSRVFNIGRTNKGRTIDRYSLVFNDRRVRRWRRTTRPATEHRGFGLAVLVKCTDILEHLRINIINSRVHIYPHSAALWYYEHEMDRQLGEGTKHGMNCTAARPFLAEEEADKVYI